MQYDTCNSRAQIGIGHDRVHAIHKVRARPWLDMRDYVRYLKYCHFHFASNTSKFCMGMWHKHKAIDHYANPTEDLFLWISVGTETFTYTAPSHNVRSEVKSTVHISMARQRTMGSNACATPEVLPPTLAVVLY